MSTERLDRAVYCSNRITGGGELSAQTLARLMNCPLISFTTNEWKTTPVPKKIIFYLNDVVYKLDKDPEYRRVIEEAETVYMVLNFTNGPVPKLPWIAKKVKRVFFLNREKLNGFQSACCEEWKSVSKRAYPPPVDILQYLDIDRPLDRRPIVIGRHSRMSLKYPMDPCYIYRELIKKIPEAHYAFQIPHRKISQEFKDDPRFILNTWNKVPVHDFLASIDIYASIISPKVHDQGPRVLIEAMAAGLPCVVENRDGMKERMINGVTGYLVDSEDEAIAKISDLYHHNDLRVQLGKNARIRAKSFDLGLWLKNMED